MQCKEPVLLPVRENNSEVMPLGDPSMAINASPFCAEIIGYDALYESMNRCKRTVLWKDPVAHFALNDVKEIGRLHSSLTNGSYRSRPGRVFKANSPKPRDILAISFRDRVYQRSLNDILLYPTLIKHFVYDNCACQRGKGTDFCRNRLKCHLQRFYRKYGRNGYILQCDVKGYYPNLQYKVAEDIFRRHLPNAQAEAVLEILNTQYRDKGFFPGSQLLQLVGIAALNGLDHFVKEKLCIKGYIRYMDDFILIHQDKSYLEYCREEIAQELERLGLWLHPTKTKVFSLHRDFKYMGFIFRLTETGKVLMFVDPKVVKRTRRKIRRLRKSHPEVVQERLVSWRAYASKGSSRRVLQL